MEATVQALGCYPQHGKNMDNEMETESIGTKVFGPQPIWGPMLLGGRVLQMPEKLKAL